MTNFNFPTYTINDYKNWQEDWELILGYPMQILPISVAKSRIISELVYQISTKIGKSKNNIFLRLDWIIDSYTVVRPDIMVVCGEPESDFLEMPPVLIIEILSPSNVKTDRVIKFELYQENGVQFYLMVDPLKEKIEVFELIDNKYKQVDKQKFQIDRNCEIDFDFVRLWK